MEFRLLLVEPECPQTPSSLYNLKLGMGLCRNGRKRSVSTVQASSLNSPNVALDVKGIAQKVVCEKSMKYTRQLI